MRQEVRFCTAPDGACIAYAIHGRGPPLVRTATGSVRTVERHLSNIYAKLRVSGKAARAAAAARFSRSREPRPIKG